MSKLQDNKFNECYVVINEKASGKGSLKDLTCAVKDNVVVANYPTTSGSETMSNFVSNYDATIVSLLKETGANIIGKVALDELGMGATGEFSFKGPVVSPLNKEYQTGGSSSGSAVAVCNGTDFSIGTDTGDSIRIPAEFTKIIGLKPSYGALSRFGVVPYASSLDHAGYFTKSFDLMTKLIEVTMKHDANDLTSVDYSKVTPVAPTKLGEAKVAFLVDVYNNAPGNIKKDFDVVLNKLKDAGVKIQEVSFDKKVYDAIADTYAIIANVEGLQSTFAIDGINWGNKKDMEVELRSKFGSNVQKRYLLAAHYLYNDKQKIVDAYKFRRFIVKKYEDIFNKFDFVISPNSESGVKKLGDPKSYIYTGHLVIHNFGGFPSITFPMVDHGDHASAVNICSWKGNDLGVIALAKMIRGEDNV